jgi:hypothetical protein
VCACDAGDEAFAVGGAVFVATPPDAVVSVGGGAAALAGGLPDGGRALVGRFVGGCRFF